MNKRNNRFDRGLAGKGSTYVRELGDFIGIDCSSDVARVSERRMARCLNMWRDYESESGGAVETVPGWRRLISAEGRINGIFGYRGFGGVEYLVVHAGKRLYRIPVSMLESATSLAPFFMRDIADAPSVFFECDGSFYVLDGSGYYCLDGMGRVVPVTSLAYVPVTCVDGAPYQQRNMLTADFIERYTLRAGENRSYNPEAAWKYELVGSGDGGHLRLVGITDAYGADQLIHAYIPDSARLGGEEYPITEFTPDFFDLLPYTTQLVVDAKLDFFGLSGSGHGGRRSGSISGMTSLQRLVLRNPFASYEFNACDRYDVSGSSPVAIPSAPLRELWIAGSAFGGFNAVQVHEYSDASAGITSAYEGKVRLYVASMNEMWVGGEPRRTETVQGVIFAEERAGGTLTLNGVRSATLESDGGATLDFSVVREECEVAFTPFIGYSHIHLNADGKTYCILTRDGDTGHTCEENGKWFEYAIRDPFRRVKSISANGESVIRYKENAVAGTVAAFLPPFDDGGVLDILLEGESDRFSEVGKLSTVYQNGFTGEASWDAINKCTVVCSYDGRVFFTGNPELPNTVFFSGRGLNGENDPTYIGIYNYLNDGIGGVPNVAMVSSSSMLAVLKGEVSSDACVYYHVAQYNTDKETAALLPRIYPSTEGVTGVPCVGAACNFADDTVFLSPLGLEGVEKRTVNLERTLSHRSGRVDPILRRSLSGETRAVEWKGYLCILNNDGTMLLADSRAMNKNEATGEMQYEWFLMDGVGSYSGDSPKWVYSGGSVALTDGDGNELLLPMEELTVTYGGMEYNVRVGVGEPTEASVPISFGTVSDGEGNEYSVSGGLSAIMIDGVFCPVETGEERVGGTFYPAKALCEFRGRLYFGSENGDVCIFNTDKRGIAYDEGEAPGVIGSRWYDRCGHRYESGFSTLSDDCGYPQFAKSTVGKTLTLRTKRLPNSSFALAVRSEREDWRQVERFTVTNGGFCETDFSSFSFEDGFRSICSSSEKMKRWGEKQLYFYADGFRQPFGIYGASYCYYLAGRLR